MTTLEHDYIGMEKIISTTSSSSSCTVSASENTKNKNTTVNNTVDNLKETELRLGLPGSESPETNKAAFGVCLFGKNLEDNKNGFLKSFVGSGAKRGFFYASNASEKWVFSGNGGSQGDLCNGGVENINNINKNKNTQNSCLGLKDSGISQTPKAVQEKKKNQSSNGNDQPAAKAQVVGWPPIRSYRKNTMATTTPKNNDDGDGKSGSGFMYIKVSMDGAPYLRKVDLKTYCNYTELSSALEKMFSCFTIGQCSSHGHPGKDGPSESRSKDLHPGSEYVLTFEDKDGDWMLVGDVPWDMFTDSCRRLRIMKASDAIGLAPRAVEKSKNHS